MSDYLRNEEKGLAFKDCEIDEEILDLKKKIDMKNMQYYTFK
jgi:hypothetical protein